VRRALNSCAWRLAIRNAHSQQQQRTDQQIHPLVQATAPRRFALMFVFSPRQSTAQMKHLIAIRVPRRARMIANKDLV
jgi:hypothetical protein